MKKEFKCKSCDNIFVAYTANLRKFCSRDCYYVFRSKFYVKDNHPTWKGGSEVKKECLKCNKPFLGKYSRVFCSKSCQVGWKSTGSKNNRWNGGKFVDRDGYVCLAVKDHPFSRKSGYVAEHRLIIEKYLGRYLKQDEIVHHINGIKSDNRLENLQLMSKIEHDRFHACENHRLKKSFHYKNKQFIS